MKRKGLLAAAMLTSLAVLVQPALADDSSYSFGTVWEMDYIRTEPGQFENYVDWLDKYWKPQCEVEKQEGYVVSCHVLAVNNPRANEPDLILATEYKDYLTTAQRKALQDKIEAYFKANTHAMDSQSGERKVLRTLAGSVESQELKLK